MLTFSPQKRITVEQALQHPYLAVLHDPSDEPVADAPLHSALFDEATTPNKEHYKQQLWKEVLHFHPHLAEQNGDATHTQPGNGATHHHGASGMDTAT